jgi:hypothetical protein
LQGLLSPFAPESLLNCAPGYVRGSGHSMEKLALRKGQRIHTKSARESGYPGPAHKRKGYAPRRTRVRPRLGTQRTRGKATRRAHNPKIPGALPGSVTTFLIAQAAKQHRGPFWSNPVGALSFPNSANRPNQNIGQRSLPHLRDHRSQSTGHPPKQTDARPIPTTQPRSVYALQTHSLG